MNSINCKFKFECPKQWSELSKTENQSVRFCDHCQSNVHWVDSEEEFNQSAQQGKCVATEILGYATAGVPLLENGEVPEDYRYYKSILVKQKITPLKVMNLRKQFFPSEPISFVKDLLSNLPKTFMGNQTKQEFEETKATLEKIDIKIELREQD